MQLQVFSFVLFLHCMEYTDSQQHASRHRQYKQTPGLNQGCQGGCQTCSTSNGCLSCKPKLFIYLERNGMRQIGVCLSACPSGYYGTRSRSPDINNCTKCKSDCDSCFNRNFCTRCKVGRYLHRGKCQESCPEGLVPSVTQRECVLGCARECDRCVNSDTCTRCKAGLYLLHGKCHHVCPEDYEPNEQLMACTPQVHCEVSEWGEWSPCSRRGKACGFKRGEETRVREVLQLPSTRGNPCGPTSETRKCIVKRKKCPGRRRGERRLRNNRKEEAQGNWQARERETERERERESSDHEDTEDRNKTEHRRSRGQDRDLTSPAGGNTH